MKIKSIKFKVTASKKLKCHKCKKELYGEEGFMHIYQKGDYGFYQSVDNVRICWNCLMNFLKEAEEDRLYRTANFQELVKKNIIRHLK